MSGAADENRTDAVRDDERLGRRVTDDRDKPPRRLKRLLNRQRTGGGVPYQEFLSPLRLPARISVDRLDRAALPDEMAGIAQRDARGAGKTFHGWAFVVADIARRRGRKVCPSPVRLPGADNPHHADIVIPGGDAAAKHLRRSHAEELAENAQWLEWRARGEIAPRPARSNFRMI